MKKQGFTLMELILSIVLVTIIIVTMVGTLLKIRESYSIINQNIEARTYKALIAKVINEHFIKNGGVKNINCSSNTKCELLLGNNKTMTLEIIENDIKTEEVKDSTNNVVATRKIQTSTLKYYGNSYNYIKTFKLTNTTYVNGTVITDGYCFKKINSNVYNYSNVKNGELSDTITNIIIETSDPNYNIELYSTAIVDKDEFKRLYTLTYNNNGGSGCYKTVAKDGEYWGTTENPLCVPNVSPVGYSFYGWFNQPSRGNEILNNVTRANGNITAYAQWTNKRFSCPSGQYLPKNSMSCEECLEDNYCPGVTDELFDKFEDQGIIPCNVGYHSESGKSSPSDCKITCSANTYLANSNDSSCTDCSHGYSTSEHSVLQGNTSSCAANIYAVQYDCNGGSGTMENSSATYNEDFVTRQNACTKTGYTFNGWNEQANGAGVNWDLNSNGVYENGNGTHPWKWTYDKDITLYAKWTAKTYTVQYKCNGGSGTMANSSATYDENFVTRQNTCTRSGYTFNGWNEEADGSGVNWNLNSNGVYENGNGTHPWKWTYDKNITLYAKWTANPQDTGDCSMSKVCVDNMGCRVSISCTGGHSCVSNCPNGGYYTSRVTATCQNASGAQYTRYVNISHWRTQFSFSGNIVCNNGYEANFFGSTDPTYLNASCSQARAAICSGRDGVKSGPSSCTITKNYN